MFNRPEPHAEPDHVERTTTEARGGYTPHIARYVLLISLALVLIAFGAILLGYMSF